MEIYLVGGAVRDELLGYPVHEHDYVVVGASPELMIERGFTPIGSDFPVFLHPQSKDEYALARTERKSARGYKGFTFNAAPTITLEEDLLRRDLTINAIAKATNGDIIDPYGGRKDIEAKRLRHVSPAFREDPVRILRVARFAARYHHLGFTVAIETLDLMREMVNNGEVDYLVAERVWKEFSRALEERHPEVFLQVLQECDALPRVMPQLATLLDASKKASAKDFAELAEIKALRQSAQLKAPAAQRFATLMHTRRLGQSDLEALVAKLKIPNETSELASLCLQSADEIQSAQDLSAENLFSLFTQSDALRRDARFFQLLEVCEMCARSRREDFPQCQYLHKALEKIQQVNPQKLIAQGYKGKELGEALMRERIQALETLTAKVKGRDPH